jgi:RNA polymerase sigma-70 factor (sigma-E family)
MRRGEQRLNLLPVAGVLADVTGMRRRSADYEFARLEALLAERGQGLLGAAVLLVGGREAGEDLLQMAIERVLRRGVPLPEELEGYLRRTLYNLATDRWRGLARRREVFGIDTDPVDADHADAVELRWAVTAALATLPPRQRAVLVLRYFEQLSEAETAEVLGCSLGTVKSSASRGLQRLRGTAALDHELRLST